MPYIKQEDRQKFNNLTTGNGSPFHVGMVGELCENAGELNYAITNIVHGYIQHKGQRYQNYNDIMGALEGVKLEIYRRFISNYENEKIIENGDVDGISN